MEGTVDWSLIFQNFLMKIKLNVFRGGKLVYQSDADRSLVNLLTKRFNPKTKYSMNAVKFFNDLNTGKYAKTQILWKVTDGWVKCYVL